MQCHGVWTTILVRARRAPIALYETLLHGYGDPTVLLVERRDTAFVLSMLKVCAVVRRFM